MDTIDDSLIDPDLLEAGPSLVQRMGSVDMADGDESDIDYDNSEDDYQDSNPDSPEEDEEGAPVEDDVFGRLAGYASRAGAGEDAGDGNAFQREIELADDEEEVVPRTRSGKGKAKAKRTHKPSHQVLHLLGQANMAYLEGNLAEAIEMYLEVIRLDPYVPAAWTTLSSCYQELGDVEKARQMRFLGAHLDDEGDSWRDLAYEFKSLGQLEQCVYSLRKALKYEPEGIDLLWDLGSVYIEQGQKARGANVFKTMMSVDPAISNDPAFVSLFRPVLIATHQRALAAEAGRKTFDYHLATYSTPTSPPSVPQAPPAMTMDFITALIDDLISIEEFEDSLEVVRSGQRWLQGRGSQKHWNALEDDREFDPPGTLRNDEESSGYEMDVAMRHRLALVRIKLADEEEADIHIDYLLTLDPLIYHALLQSLGDALMDRSQWDRALDCYAIIQECDELADDTGLIFKIGVCQWKTGALDSALEALQWVTSIDPDNLDARLKTASVLEDMGRKAEALDLVTEVIRTRASRGTLSSTLQPLQPHQKVSKRVLEDQMRSQMQSLWLDVQAAERGTMEGEEGAVDRFVEAAGVLVENYRMDRSNFGKNRGVVRVLKSKKAKKNDIDDQAAEMQDRLERTLGLEDDEEAQYHVFRKTSFYGLSNEEWLTLVVKYCCVLMVRREEDVAMDILEHVVWSGLFHNRRCEIALRMTMIACAMRMKAWSKILESTAQLIIHSQFLPQPYLVMLGALASGGLAAHSAYTIVTFQNLMNRDLRTFDDAVEHGEKKLHFNEGIGRWTANKGKTKGEDGEKSTKKPKGQWKKRRQGEPGAGDAVVDEDVDMEDENARLGGIEGEGIGWGYRPVLPKKCSPYMNFLLAQEMLASRSFQGAIFYLLRAYNIDQWNPYICLLIAQAYFGRAMQRQSDNRPYQISQGMIFLDRYRRLSPQEGKPREEVEYNFARAFHGMGLSAFAVKHYEKVLEGVQSRMDECMEPEAVRKASLAWEAAHNLMLLYASSGNMALVKEKSIWMAI
ncbi:hypothetical protein I350_03588 [Cryptococcus amylolentus CBS 6273]|uniref:Uncharacterized protein n=1 Tax=Cryptococcus amylolentus CBS 6273 TaxID=1296118 RepID=A0A1E3K4R2_9TREE|nr:hypothetical protein I350_03588 [Cryptococcus amylolentus CBS 6273]